MIESEMRATVRPRRAEDLAALAAAMRATHEADGYPHHWPAADPAAFLAPPRALDAWTAELDGRPVGQVVLEPADAAHDEIDAWLCAEAGLEPARTVLVARLFAAPAARGRGAGSVLFDTAVSSARERGLLPALTVADGNAAARALYARRGWRLIASRPWPWPSTSPSTDPAALHAYAP